MLFLSLSLSLFRFFRFSLTGFSRVSKLMKRICNPEEALDDSLISDVCVSDERKEEVKAAIAEWHFCAHDFTDDELCYASCLMFEHTLTIPDLEHWRISSGKHPFLSFFFFHRFIV